MKPILRHSQNINELLTQLQTRGSQKNGQQKIVRQTTTVTVVPDISPLVRVIIVWLQNGHVILTDELGRPVCKRTDLLVIVDFAAQSGGSTAGIGAEGVVFAGKGSSIATATGIGILPSNGGADGAVKLPSFMVIQRSFFFISLSY